MSNGITCAVTTIIAVGIIAATIFVTAPRYEVIEVQQGFNNGFGAWRLDTRSGEMSLCSATPGGLICSVPAIELADQKIAPAAAAPVALQKPTPAEEKADEVK